jgi:hypothetical protein
VDHPCRSIRSGDVATVEDAPAHRLAGGIVVDVLTSLVAQERSSLA